MKFSSQFGLKSQLYVQVIFDSIMMSFDKFTVNSTQHKKVIFLKCLRSLISIYIIMKPFIDSPPDRGSSFITANL
jgi:hypothetical protein